MPVRDPSQLLHKNFTYIIGTRGVEPKLALDIRPLEPVMQNDITLKNLLTKIIIGPTNSTPRSVMSYKKMLGMIEREQFIDLVHASTIPFRHL